MTEDELLAIPGTWIIHLVADLVEQRKACMVTSVVLLWYRWLLTVCHVHHKVLLCESLAIICSIVYCSPLSPALFVTTAARRKWLHIQPASSSVDVSCCLVDTKAVARGLPPGV